MTDGFAFGIVFIGGLIIFILKMRSHGEYQEMHYLSAGNYLVGEDIPKGKGDLVAESGSGSFIIKNRKTKNWSIGNLIGTTSGQQPSRFRNLSLNNGDLLEINGNVVLVLKGPIPIEKISEENLGPGIYRFGVDVPPGKYDLEIVSGDGDVLLVEVGKDNYTFYQDMSLENPFKADSFVNVNCTPLHELWINGNLQVKLKYSKKQPTLLRKILQIAEILTEPKNP